MVAADDDMAHDVRPLVTVSAGLGPDARERIEAVLAPVARVAWLDEAGPDQRARWLGASRVVLAWAPHRELSPAEQGGLARVALLQLLSAGADHVDFTRLPSTLTVASNVGAYARPMAEHTLAMVLALAKRLFAHHLELRQGVFDQFSESRALAGATAAILGFGGIGREVARLFRAFDVRILAVNRSGRSAEPVELVGTTADLPEILPRADIVVVTLPLNRGTRGLIGRRELGMMKPDAVLVNVGRGETIDQAALYEHLRRTPSFQAGIDAWWTEPFRHGRFELEYPFLDLPNVIGSPHNSALVPGALAEAAQKAAENIRRFLLGQPMTGVVRPEDYVADDSAR